MMNVPYFIARLWMKHDIYSMQVYDKDIITK